MAPAAAASASPVVDMLLRPSLVEVLRLVEVLLLLLVLVLVP